MFSYFEPNFIEKFLWESAICVVFKILAKIEMMRNKNRLFGRHFKTVQHFHFFVFLFFLYCRIMIFYSAFIYGANFIAKLQWKSGFLRGVSCNPFGHQRE